MSVANLPRGHFRAIIANQADGHTPVKIPWQLRIGDPTFTGWVIAIGYFAAAVCYAAIAVKAAQQQTAENRRYRLLWWMVAALLFGLALNKQMDLQTALTAIGRSVARQQGWYAQRRIVQFWFAFFASGGAVLTLCVCWSRLRQFRQEQWLLFAAIVVLTVFIIARLVSFHHVDQLLGIRIGKAKLAHALELAAIVLFLVAARSGRRQRNRGGATENRTGINRCRTASRTPSQIDTSAN